MCTVVQFEATLIATSLQELYHSPIPHWLTSGSQQHSLAVDVGSERFELKL